MNSQIQESNVNTENKKQHIFATIKKFLKDMQQKLYKAPWLYLVFCFFAKDLLMLSKNKSAESGSK